MENSPSPVHPSVEVIRTTLLSRFGKERYDKFVLTINSDGQYKKRLYFWQEEMWSAVQAELGLSIEDFEVIRAHFRLCHVHGDELRSDSVRIEYGTHTPAPREQVELAQRLFPYANTMAYGPCWVEKESRREVWFCPQCRAALKVYESGLPDLNRPARNAA